VLGGGNGGQEWTSCHADCELQAQLNKYEFNFHFGRGRGNYCRMARTLDTGHWTWDFGLRTLATVVFIGGLLTCANGKSDGKGKASDTLRIRHVGPVVLSKCVNSFRFDWTRSGHIHLLAAP